MYQYCIPHSGRFLVSQLAAYGLAYAASNQGTPAFVGHDQGALDSAVWVETEADPAQVAAVIRSSAEACTDTIEADITPGLTGNNRIPVIRARMTDIENAKLSLCRREALLDQLAEREAPVPMGLIASLGAPATWRRSAGKSPKPRPQDGATRLDGVAYNRGSDIVRSPLRHYCAEALICKAEHVRQLFVKESLSEEQLSNDRFGWSPPGTSIDTITGWMAALGLSLLPVGLAESRSSVTPAAWQDPVSHARGITLPVFACATSVPRLRAILQLPELSNHSPSPGEAGRLRAYGIDALAVFYIRNQSSGKMVQFSFEAATRIEL